MRQKAEAPIPCRLLVENIGELVTVAGNNRKPRVGKAFADLGIIHDGALAVGDGGIAAVGTLSEVRKRVTVSPECVVLDAGGRLVTPGLVDGHTHVCFAGTRPDEFIARSSGGRHRPETTDRGINSTVRATRGATDGELLDLTRGRLLTMLHHGTTALEAKSGYGLEAQAEERILEIYRDLAGELPIDIAPTFLGGHAVPAGSDPDAYVREIVETMIPSVARQGLAAFNDVFCEQGFFTSEQTRAVLEAGMRHNLRPKVHADELSDTGGAALAAEMGAVSADHLLFANDAGLDAMAKAGTIAVLLPGTSFFLDIGRYAPAGRMRELGVAIALGTDCNPGSCYTENLQLVLTLACLKLHLLPAEALVAATINAAHSCSLAGRLGSLEVGKQADFIIWDVPDHRHLPYHFGVNLARTVVKRGQVVFP